MLLPDNIHPENSIYYNGAIVLEVLKKRRSFSFLDLYREVKELSNMSFPVYVLSLDWLYLIDIAKLKNGKIELCS
jgi:hypothetical protein